MFLDGRLEDICFKLCKTFKQRGTVEMVFSLKANKKRIMAFVVLALIVVGAAFLLKQKGSTAPKKQDISLESNEARVNYLKSFGWDVNDEPAETREVMIPEKFNDIYTTYNDMQKKQGFDLKPYSGYRCMQYKYKINNYPNEAEVYATLLVYDVKLLGGDLSCAKVDGFMHGFAADSAHYGEKGNPKNNENAPGSNENAPNSNENAPGSNENAPNANENAPNSNENAPTENNQGGAENNAENNVENNAEKSNGTEVDTTGAETEFPVD